MTHFLNPRKLESSFGMMLVRRQQLACVWSQKRLWAWVESDGEENWRSSTMGRDQRYQWHESRICTYMQDKTLNLAMNVAVRYIQDEWNCSAKNSTTNVGWVLKCPCSVHGSFRFFGKNCCGQLHLICELLAEICSRQSHCHSSLLSLAKTRTENNWCVAICLRFQG